MKQMMKQIECNPMRLLAGTCVLALGLLGVGMAAASASAQTLAVSNQVFPLTQVGQSTSQAVTFTYSDDLWLNSVQIDPAYSEYALTGVSCGIGNYLPAGTPCTLTISFAPKLPGWASAPAPISRSAPVQIGLFDTDNSATVTATFAVTGTGTGPVAAMSPGLISDPVGSDTAVEDYVNTPYGGDGGPASAAIFYNPAAMAVDTLGNLYIADTYNEVVRVVYKGGTQLASLIALENSGTIAVVGDIYTIAGVAPTLNPYSNNFGFDSDGLLATQSRLANPQGVAVDAAGNIYIADGSQAVRMVSATTGLLKTVAGTLGGAGYSGDSGPATSAQLYNPLGIAVDGNGNIYITDSGNAAIRVVYAGGTPLASLIATENGGATAVAGNIYTVAGGQGNTYSSTGTLASTSGLYNPTAVTVDSQGNLFIAEYSVVDRVDAVSGMLTNAYWGHPISGLAVDASDNFYFGLPQACTVNQYSLLISLPYATTTVAGNGSCAASGDAGNVTTAGLSGVQAMVVDGTGSLYILEPDGVRTVNASVTSLAFPNAQFGVQDPQQTLSIADADIQNYPLGSTAPSTMTPLAENTGTTGLVVTAPFLVVAPTSLPTGTADCGTLAMSLTPGQSCLAAVTVQSTTDGPVSASTTYPDNSVSFAGAPLAINLSATISGTAPTVSLTGGPLTFYSVPNAGASAAQTLTLTNLSTTTPLAITSIAASGAFAATNNCGSALAAATSCTISVTFTTSTTGLLSGTVTVRDDATTGSGVQTASVSGTGVYPTATLTGGPLTFTGVAGMGYGTAQTLMLTNTSSQVPLTISSINGSGTFTNGSYRETDNCGTLLAANSSCTLSVSYAASASGIQTMTLTVTDNATSGGGTQSASLSGTGTAPVAGVSPGSINFGTLAPGTTSSASIVTVSNTGTAPLTFCSTAVVAPSTTPVCFGYYTGTGTAAFTLSGNEAGMFSVVGTTCGATLAISSSCTVSVAFSPYMPGYFTATLSANDNSGGTGLRDFYASQNVGLVGSSFTPAGRSSFTIGNATFPATALGQSTTQTVTLQLNNSLALKSIAMQTGFTEYTLGTVSGCTVDGTTVNPSTTICSIPVTFTPTAPGIRNAPLVLTTTENGGTPYAFALSGTGTGPVAALTPGIISRYVGGSGGVCDGVAGEDGIPAANAFVGYLNGMAIDAAGNMYLSDSMNYVIWRVDPSGNIHMFAGNPFSCGGYDQFLNGNGGAALGADVEDGGPLAVDSVGGLYIGDNAANSAPSIRYINPVTKIITSVLGNLSNTGNQGNSWESNTYFYPGSIIQESVAVPNTPPSTGTHNVNYLFTVTQGGTSGSTGPVFPYTTGATVVDGSVTWTNSGAGTTTGVGCPGQTDSFGDGCTGTNASLYGVSGIALDQAGNLYFADRYTFVSDGHGGLNAVYNAVVRRMDAHTGIVTIYAGTGTTGHTGDGGLATSAKIIPGDLAFDSNGNLYIDEGLQVRMVNATTHIITTVAGSGVASRYQQDVCYGGGVGDGGPALSAGFGGMSGIAFDAANNLYLLDATGCDVRRVDAATQTITTIAGNHSAYAFNYGDINNIYGFDWYGSAYVASLAQPLLARVDGLGNIYVMQMADGVRKIDVSKSVLDYSSYGTVATGSSNGPQTVTVLNAGNTGPLTFNSPFIDPTAYGISTVDFTRDVSSADCILLNNNGLAPGTECPVNIDFTPTMAGNPLADTDQVTDNGALPTQTINLYGVSSGTAAPVTLLPPLLSFASMVNVTTAAQNFTLANNTSSSLPITSIILSGSGASVFAQTNNCGTTLAANSSCQIAVTFSPTVSGQFIATVTVSDVVSGTPATQTAGLTGLTGTPNAILTEDQLNFGSQNVGITSAAKTLTLISTGVVPLTISSITLTGTDISQFAISATTCGTSLAANAHCTISVTFTPTSGSSVVNTVTTPFSAYVSVADNAPNTPQVSHLTGTAASSLNFGSVTVNTTSPTQTVTLTNNQTSSVTIASLAVTPGIPYSINASSTCLNPTLAAGASCTVVLAFSPVTLGVASAAALTITDSAPSSPQTVSLSGTGIATTTQAIAFTDSLPAMAVYSSGLTYTISATGGGSGNAVTFGATGPATLTGSTLTITGVGTVVVTANQAGNSNYSAATAVTQSVVVTKSNTATAVISSSNPAIVGQSVTFTATVSAVAPSTGTPTGTVQFKVNGSAVGSPVTPNSSGQATYTTSTLATGASSITAVYSGDSNFNGSTSSTLSQTMNPSTTTTLGLSANTVVYGQPVTFTATVTAGPPLTGTPTGSVQFNGVPGGSTVTLNSSGQATFTASALAVGGSPYSVSATYTPNSSTYAASTSSSSSLTVNKANTAAAVSSSSNPAIYGQPVTFTATVSAVAPSTAIPTGTVQFSVNGSAVGSPVSLSSGQATYAPSTLPIGITTISASYSGDGNCNTSISSTLSQTVNKANTAAAVSSSSNPSIYGQPVTFTATVSAVAPSTGTPTGTVQFSVNGSSVGSPVSLSSGQATYSSSLAVGSDSIAAVYSGDSNFIGSTATALSQTVNKASQTITFTAPTSPVTYGVSPITLVATGGASGNAVVFSVTSGPATVSGSTLTITGAGTVVVAANQAGNTNYSAATAVTQSIVVSQATPAITWPTPAAISYGTALGATQLDASSTVAGTFAYSPAAGAVLGAGSQTLSVTFTPTNTTNYATATANVTLAVNKASLLVTANSPAIAYGAAVPSYTAAITGFQGTDTAATAVTGSASLTTVPAVPSAVGGYTITTAQGTLAAANYTFSFANGSLTIAKATSALTGPALSAQPVQVAFNQTGSVPVTVTGQYSGAGIATPTGTISYTIGTGNAQTAAISSGTATVSIPSTQASGLYTVAVTYAGDTGYSAATALNFQVQVGPQAQTIAFNSLAPVTYGAAPITLSATATSGLPVTFTIKSGPATLNGNVLTATGAGSVVVAADQAGNALWQAATEVTQTLTVGKAAPAAIGLASSSNPVLVQNAVTLTATVSSAAGSPTGTVTFLDGLTPLGTGTLAGGVATLSTSGLAVGSHTITAVYSGDGNFISATSAALTEVVDDFNLAISVTGGASTITSVTVLPGGTAVFTFVVSPINAATFPTAVTLSASGLPLGATATFSPATLAAGSGTTTVTLTIQIPQTGAALQPTHDLGRGLAPFALALLLLPFAGRLRRAGRRLSRAVSLLLLLSAGIVAAAGLSGCGSSSGFFAQQQTTYTVTVTGTSGLLSHSTTVTLTVE